MAEKRWKGLGSRVCALSLAAALAFTPVMAQAMTLDVVKDEEKGENVYRIKATLQEGLNEKPVTIQVLNANNEPLFKMEGESNAEGKVSVSVDLSGVTKPNETIYIKAKCDDETTPDEATKEYVLPAASDITLRTPNVDVSAQSAVVSGSAQPGMEVEVSVTSDASGKTSQNVTAGADGTFSATFSNLSYGDYTARAAYTDASIGGNAASTTFSLAKPAAALKASATGGDNVVTVNATGEPGAAVTASVAGQTQSGTFDASGACTFVFSDVAAGTYTVQVSDAYGQSASAEVTVTKPAAVLKVSAVGGENVATVDATGEPGAAVTASVAGQTQNGAFDASGACTFVFSDVAAGKHTVQVSDSTGQSASTEVTVTDKPAVIVQRDIAVTSVKPGAECVTVEGTASAGAAVHVSGFGKEADVIVNADGRFTCNLTGVAAGTYNALAVTYVDDKTYTGKPTSLTGTWNVTVSTQNVLITSATGGAATLTVAGTAKAGEKLVLTAKNASTGKQDTAEATADANGQFTYTFSNLTTGKYTVSVAYHNAAVGSGASVENVTVAPAGASNEKLGITLDKLYETSLTVVGKTTPGCNVTVKVNYSGKEVSISRQAGSDGIFRIPLPRTMKKHTTVTVTVTYTDGTTATAEGHVYAGSAAEEYNTVYRVGSVSNDVYYMEDRLKTLGYPITPDRVYDDETARIVRIFQRNNGLDVDGKAGPKTLTKLYSVTAVGYTGTDTPTDYIYLLRGSRGTLVSQVQSRLKELGYYTIRVDGIFGVGTQSAVRAFQRNNGLSVTGVVNSECYKAIMDTNAIGSNGSGTDTTDYVELRRGNRGNAVVRLQARLQALGYYTISVDGIYGSGTQAAVRRFQSRNGISANGVATVYTQQVLFSASAIANSSSTGSSTGYVYLHYGSNGQAVKRLQTALKNAGYYKGAVDGQYYDQTYAAVKAFQRAAGLSVDGIAGRKTQNALYGTNY